MTILHVLDHSLPTLSGYSTRSWNIVSSQRALGLRPIVLTSPKHPARGPNPELLKAIPHYRTPPPSGRSRRSAYVGEVALMVTLARRIVEVARAEGAVALHAHSPVLNGLPALWAARRLGLPLVYEARAFWEDAAVDHGTTREGSLRYRVSRILETLLFKRADRVVVIAEPMRKEIVRRGVDPRRVRVVPNGVDVERFQPRPPSADLGARLGLQGSPVLGFIGSFYRYEGLRFLLEAVPEIRRRVPQARVLLVGGGEEESALHTLAADLGQAVVFTGRVSHDHIHDYHSLIDVFVCPRRRMRLTELVTPLKPLEAMAVGRPVLASDVGGLSELIEHRQTGVLFPAESREALVEEAVRLATDPVIRDELGQRARRTVLEKHAWPHVVQRYLGLYQELL